MYCTENCGPFTKTGKIVCSTLAVLAVIVLAFVFYVVVYGGSTFDTIWTRDVELTVTNIDTNSHKLYLADSDENPYVVSVNDVIFAKYAQGDKLNVVAEKTKNGLNIERVYLTIDGEQWLVHPMCYQYLD